MIPKIAVLQKKKLLKSFATDSMLEKLINNTTLFLSKAGPVILEK